MRAAAMRTIRVILLALAVLFVGYLAVLALRPEARLPGWFNWFGRPASWPTIAIVIGVLAILGMLSYLTRRDRASATVPVVVVAGLIATSFILAFASYWKCSNERHPPFFTTLAWTASLIKGGVEDRSLDGITCPTPPAPVALEVARLTILAAIFVSVVGIAAAVFRSQSDRVQAWLARSITAVVDIDDDAIPMLRAIARRQASYNTLVLLTDSPERPSVTEARTQGARVIKVDFDRPESVGTHRLWRHVDHVYLLSPDPSTNLERLRVIRRRLATVDAKQRIPLIVRIDSPWLSDAWLGEQFGERTGTRWAPDAVGKYEVTARRLLDNIIEAKTVTRLIICGASPLTLTLLDNLARRKVERNFQHVQGGEPDVPTSTTIVAPNAAEYKRDHDLRQQRRFGAGQLEIEVVSEAPSQMVLGSLIERCEDKSTIALIIVDPVPGSTVDAVTATRLAALFPTMRLYSWDPQAPGSGGGAPIVGQLRTYRLGMELPDGQARDNWEHAAMRIHERYSAKTDHTQPPQKPWAELDDFYKQSNFRQVENTLWMVEQIAGHTWNTLGDRRDHAHLEVPGNPTPQQLLEIFRQLGFGDDAVWEMARAEFEDWKMFYKKHGWKHGLPRDYETKRHERLVSWEDTVKEEALWLPALRSLAQTLTQLRELGYWSTPLWQPHRRIEHVMAKRHWTSWTWTSRSGRQTVRANAGSWEVWTNDDDHESWPVSNNLFLSSYSRAKRKGHRCWERTGTVWARPARQGETIETPDGLIHADNGDWVVQGESGQQWVIPHAKFQLRYATGRYGSARKANIPVVPNADAPNLEPQA